MDKFVIKGRRPLNGEIVVDGSKNAGLPILFATLLIDKGESVIRNIPPLRDIFTTIKMLQYLGAKVDYDEKKQIMAINAETIKHNTAPYELMNQMRASFLVLGPIIARLGEARISLPGGCVLGARPVDFHIKAFGLMGAKIKEKAGYVVAQAKPMLGGRIYFDRPSHTGTENVLFGGIFAKGATYIANAACDPEIIDVVRFLNKAGAKITGAGTPTLTMEPVKRLKAIDYTVSGDRLVAGTYLYGAAMTGGKVNLKGIDPEHLTMVDLKLREMGCEITNGKNSMTIKGPRRLKAVSITTFPYPGYPTDLQACHMAACCIATGTSYIKETVFKDRFSHAPELSRLGATVNVSVDEAIVQGVKELNGAEIMSSDIRAGAGLVLAGLAAKGRTELQRVYHVDRGYYRLEEKLSALGADIVRVQA